MHEDEEWLDGSAFAQPRLCDEYRVLGVIVRSRVPRLVRVRERARQPPNIVVIVGVIDGRVRSRSMVRFKVAMNDV
jgi:hypothetical protein